MRVRTHLGMTDAEVASWQAARRCTGDLECCVEGHDHRPDPVNHPSHYRLANGAEVIDLTENLNFCRGNAVKYICRAGAKDPATEIQDLEKARWYIDRELTRLKGGSDGS